MILILVAQIVLGGLAAAYKDKVIETNVPIITIYLSTKPT